MARIIVIDDSVSIIEAIEMFLSEAGHEIVISTSGRRGIQLLRRQAADLVITDIYMPDEDGLQVIQDARRLCPQTPVIAMSGMTGEYNMLRVAECLGACCTLQKPFSNEQLLEAVNAALSPAPGCCNSRLKGKRAATAPETEAQI